MATGNSLAGSVESGDVDVQSNQSMQGNASASTTLNVTTDAGLTVSVTTEAVGNTGEADSLGGGALTGSFGQQTGPVAITAQSQMNADNAQAGDVSIGTTAIANDQGLANVGGSQTTFTEQTNQASVDAEGGAVLKYTGGTASLSALAVGNNVTSTGITGSNGNVHVSQSNTGDLTQAAQFVAMGNAQTVNNATTATGNNISITNEDGPLEVHTDQDNESYVRSQAETTSYEWGLMSTMATGVGNSAIAGQNGQEIFIDNSQTNGGAGVDVIASSSGTDGYDLGSTATAMGNAFTGYACSTCSGTLTAHNSQINSADIGASSSLSVGSSARSATGVATAVGNSATFYVSHPGS